MVDVFAAQPLRNVKSAGDPTIECARLIKNEMQIGKRYYTGYSDEFMDIYATEVPGRYRVDIGIVENNDEIGRDIYYTWNATRKDVGNKIFLTLNDDKSSVVEIQRVPAYHYRYDGYSRTGNANSAYSFKAEVGQGQWYCNTFRN